jgi:hypothetical protein
MPWPRSHALALIAVLAGCSTAKPLPRSEWTSHLDGSHPPPDIAVEPGPTNTRKVRVVYLTPSDRTARSIFSELLTRSARHLQRWFRDALPGKSFALASPVVTERKTKNSASWYSTHLTDGKTVSFWENVYADGNDAASVQRADPDNVWLVYIDADPACGQGGGCMESVCVFSANDLRGLAQEKLTKVCSSDTDTPLPVCRWVGGMGQMLGLGLGLPFPPGCIEKLSTCDSGALMWSGMYDYPNAHLTESDRVALLKSPFFSDWTSITPLGSCNPL